MAQDVSNFIRITVPTSRTGDPLIDAAMRNMTQHCGGCTILPASGVWVEASPMGDKVHAEPVVIATWNFANNKLDGARVLARLVVDAMHSAGELAVMRERQYQGDYAARIYHR